MKKKTLEFQESVVVTKANTTPPSEATSQSVDSDSGLPGHIMLCHGTRFCLTSNLRTAARFTNGAKGVVHGIIYEEGVKRPALHRAVICISDKYTRSA